MGGVRIADTGLGYGYGCSYMCGSGRGDYSAGVGLGHYGCAEEIGEGSGIPDTISGSFEGDGTGEEETWAE